MNHHSPSASKYEPLKRHLERVQHDHLPMRFAEIEAMLGFPLPPSARKHRAWWSNNPSNSVITHSWLKAGFRTEAVNLEQGRLIFRRAKTQEQSVQPGLEPGRHPILGCMKGSVTYAADFDPSEPADPEWGQLAFGRHT